MEIRHISKFLILSLVVNALMMLAALSTTFVFRERAKNYKPKFPISDDDILKKIGETTFLFLTNYQAQVESKQDNDSTNSLPEIVTADFCIYGGFRGDRMVYGSSEYGVGDFVDFGKGVWSIEACDFERQRVYLRRGTRFAVGISAPPRRAVRGEAGRDDDGNREREDNGTL